MLHEQLLALFFKENISNFLFINSTVSAFSMFTSELLRRETVCLLILEVPPKED